MSHLSSGKTASELTYRKRQMTASTMSLRAAFAAELKYCLETEGYSEEEFAQRLLADNVSIAAYKDQRDTQDTIAWLTQSIRTLEEMSAAADSWPIPAHVFIPAAAKCCPHIFLAEWRLTMAAALDTLRRNDP